ncbi:hypothetical protein L9F63_022276 [Diploptera punctata]|uniref:Uncharacterized protein n=1 Tax=Diploptera punctata TaxID=6984 RepID=A0AAD7ZM87_DIPPU|nr:hypothetical protein L9F63_022276 [Diploptera punctata]
MEESRSASRVLRSESGGWRRRGRPKSRWGGDDGKEDAREIRWAWQGTGTNGGDFFGQPGPMMGCRAKDDDYHYIPNVFLSALTIQRTISHIKCTCKVCFIRPPQWCFLIKDRSNIEIQDL